MTADRPDRRARLRLALVLLGVLPTLVALAFALKVVTMLSHDRDGRSRFDDGAFVSAADEFGANGSLNWFEPWIAAFDEGAARHADGDLDQALQRYATALEDVPAAEECTVRINAALAHETLGDTAQEDGDADEAAAQWQAGIDTLAQGSCPVDSGRGREQTADAAKVDQRLRDKLAEQQQSDDKDDKQKDQKDKSDQQDDKDQQSPEERQQQREERRQERKERKLEERNDEGIEDQQDYEDQQQERDYSEYHW